MADVWYSRVGPNERLMQGDLILDCPVVVWSPGAGGDFSAEELSAQVTAQRADLVVMTQACDLEQENVDRVVVCVNYPVKEFYVQWREQQQARGKSVKKEAFKGLSEQVRKGFKWNLHMLNEGETDGLGTPIRIVDFHDVHTIPRDFLEAFNLAQGQPRLRLRPPYREHLSQSFARFFMRVGLPTDIDTVWLPGDEETK